MIAWTDPIVLLAIIMTAIEYGARWAWRWRLP